jgi:hypothetical protein
MFPGYITGYLLLLVALEFTLRGKRGKYLRTVENIFLVVFFCALTIIFVLSAWHFGGVGYVWNKIMPV